MECVVLSTLNGIQRALFLLKSDTGERMKKFSRILICMVLVLLIGILNGVDKPKNNKLIGVILPFTSAFAGIANEQKDAIELAMQNFTDYEVIYKDSKRDAAGAVIAFNELLALDNPPFTVISCASWVATALHPLAAEANIFHIVIASANFKRTDPKHTVRFTLDASQEENQLANYLSKFQRIAIYNMDNSYGNGWKKTIEINFKDKIVKAIAYNPQHKDFKNDLLEMKNVKPDALVMLSAGNGALIAKQARQLGITAQFIGTRPIERPELLVEAEFTNGLVFTYPTYDVNHPMLTLFTKTYGIAPTIFGVEAYTSINSLIIAANLGNLSTSALFDWYAGKTYTGALGEIHFDETGDAHYPYMYKEISDGEFITAPFQFEMLLNDAKQEIEKTFKQIDKNERQAVNELSDPSFFEKIISRKVTNFPIEMWIMKKDGTIIYDDNKSEIGLNIFSNEIYAAYPSLVKMARTMSSTNNGKGEYTFLDVKMKENVTKKIIWATIILNDIEYRLALTHIKNNI
jgi:ABC-type branched-subunit amino acid transport system substrate-binding protein